jgi:hypothetical protein
VADQQQNDGPNPRTDIWLERLKMYQDSFKHMTTFCSGAIVLSAAVTAALFPKPDGLGWLGISIVLFALGAFLSMVGLLIVASYMDSDAARHPLGRYLRNSVIAAYGGLAFFALFIFGNLTR